MPPCLRVFALCLTTTFLFAQSPDWKQDKGNDKGNRWEGLLGQDQNGDEWEPRSFTAFVENYPLNRPSKLAISYYVPGTAKAFVQAQEIYDDLHYRMQPKDSFLQTTSGWRSFRGWDTDLLLDKRISSDSLGLLVKVGDPGIGNLHLAPAIVRAALPPAPVSEYRLVFYTMKEVAKNKFTVQAGDFKREFDQPAGGPRGIVTLQFPAVGLPEGDVHVLVNAPLKGIPGTKAVKFQVDFSHTGSVPR